MIKKYSILISIIVVAAFLRLYLLGNVPAGVTNDEMGYIYNAYSIAKTGNNVFGLHLPLLTWINEGGFPFLPVETYLLVPFFWLFGLSATVGRLPSALMGIGDVLLLYILVKRLTKQNSLALLSAFFLAISSWQLHFARSAYDPNFAVFFYLLGMVVFFYEIEKKRIPIFSSLSFLLAVFSYRGMNVIFLPMILLLYIYSIKTTHITRKQILGSVLGILIVCVLLFIVVISNGRSYIAEAFSSDPAKIQEYLDTQIRQANGPLFVRRLFLNKPMYAIDTWRENYIKAYSPEFLFLYTEPSKIYSIWSRGRIYYIDALFILFGIGYLYKKNKNSAIFFVSLLIIGGFPGMLGGMPYSARNLFLSLLYPIFTAGGVLCIVSYRSNNFYKILISLLIVIMYAYVFGSYLFDYYYRYAYDTAEPWFKSIKDVNILIDQNRGKYSNFIIGKGEFTDVLQYGLYAKIDPHLVQDSWKNKSAGINKKFVLQSITFSRDCLEDQELKFLQEKKTLYIGREGCNKLATPSAYIRDYFGNVVWKVY